MLSPLIFDKILTLSLPESAIETFKVVLHVSFESVDETPLAALSHGTMYCKYFTK